MSSQDNKFNTLLKVAITKNTKKPAFKNWQNKEHQRKYINSDNYNVAISTGTINNLICIDIDIKDDGVNEFKKYIKQFGEPMTVKQKTPSGGEHFIFTYTSTNKDDEYLIQHYLTNKTKFRNKGIDIRAEGGCFLTYPSTINDKKYDSLQILKKHTVETV
jgi:hypothetical protein